MAPPHVIHLGLHSEFLCLYSWDFTKINPFHPAVTLAFFTAREHFSSAERLLLGTFLPSYASITGARYPRIPTHCVSTEAISHARQAMLRLRASELIAVNHVGDGILRVRVGRRWRSQGRQRNHSMVGIVFVFCGPVPP